MKSYEQHLSLAESPDRRPAVTFQEMTEVSEFEAGVLEAAFEDPEPSKEQLYECLNALQTQNKELKAYAHIVAHDLKDPLTVMVTTADLITHIPSLSRRELKEHLWQIRSTAYEMSRIINNLLLLAEVSKVDVPVECMDMARVVANVRDRLRFMIEEQKAQIDLPKTWPTAIGYAPWLEEVWANYLSNAIKHGGRPPHVKLGASAQADGMIRFWMRDNGPGLPTNVKSNLFTSFSQIGRTCNSGHGLGLSIVLSIVEKLGGQVGLESELGKGSLFFFTLPASPSY
jgi:signal transduction histidine kinase